jgi:hypothetical protein
VPELQNELAKDPDDSLKKYRVVFAQGKGVSWNINKTFNAQRGIRVVSAEQWARENLREALLTTSGETVKRHFLPAG